MQPWSIAFLPGGDILITERPGRCGSFARASPAERRRGHARYFHHQGGLLEVMPHLNFASNRLLYLTYSKPGATEQQSTMALIRGRFENDRLTNVEQLFESASGRGHYSAKIAFDKNASFLTSATAVPEGNRSASGPGPLESPRQDARLHDDGKVPTDNPFVSQANAAGDRATPPQRR